MFYSQGDLCIELAGSLPTLPLLTDILTQFTDAAILEEGPGCGVQPKGGGEVGLALLSNVCAGLGWGLPEGGGATTSSKEQGSLVRRVRMLPDPFCKFLYAQIPVGPLCFQRRV